MIELKKLCVRYRREDILKDTELRVENGRVTVLLGPNGSGKSTLMKAVAGIIPASSGSILVDGLDTAEISQRVLAQHVSYMAQTRNTPSIIARRMVLHGRFPYLSYPRRYTDKDMLIADRALADVGAEDISGEMMNELSGGQRQKVYLAMTLAQDTDNILMDEPLNFLDIQHQLNLIRLSRELAESGKAVLLVMHDIRLAMQTAGEIIVMDKGQILMQGSPEEVYQSGIIDRVFGVKLRRTVNDGSVIYYYE